MSCFPGRLHEFKEISLDQFAGENTTSSVYFLSHCHSDHMVGLSSSQFSAILSENSSVKVYCHDVTAGLLLGLDEYVHLQSSIHSLDCGTDYSIAVPSQQDRNQIAYYVTVSLIPAGHCPGSVMFLIRRDHTTVLYTGDFRLHKGDAPRLQQLFNGDGQLRYKIDSVYVDTTFCVPAAHYIPNRENCLSIIQDTITKWLRRDLTAVVHIYSRSRYGYEFLMKSLSIFFGSQIHVTATQYDRYRCVPSIQKFLTTDPNSTKIHFCQAPLGTPGQVRPPMPCLPEQKTRSNVLTLIPSAMYFTRFNVNINDMVATESPNVVRVCYSSHSSYEEIVDFLKFLQPVNIYPNVKPNDNLSLEDVRASLSFLEANNIAVAKTRDPFWNMSDFMRRSKTRKCVILEYTKKLEAEEAERNASAVKTYTAQSAEDQRCPAPQSLSAVSKSDSWSKSDFMRRSKSGKCTEVQIPCPAMLPLYPTQSHEQSSSSPSPSADSTTVPISTLPSADDEDSPIVDRSAATRTPTPERSCDSQKTFEESTVGEVQIPSPLSSSSSPIVDRSAATRTPTPERSYDSQETFEESTVQEHCPSQLSITPPQRMRPLAQSSPVSTHCTLTCSPNSTTSYTSEQPATPPSPARKKLRFTGAHDINCDIPDCLDLLDMLIGNQ